jgi:hypothetical protein
MTVLHPQAPAHLLLSDRVMILRTMPERRWNGRRWLKVRLENEDQLVLSDELMVEYPPSRFV